MKYLDEYRNERVARNLLNEIRRIQTRPWVIMEVCGGQTHSIVRNGIDFLLPEGVELVHGPGCPVCVTPLETIDKAHAIAARPDVIFCSFGDMLRVPGSEGDLFTLKSRGADIRVVYSPLDCLKIARANPEKKVVFFAIGFETTAPANAMLVFRARQDGVKNLSILVSHSLVPPSMSYILQSPQNRVQGFLGPGHVCTIMGYREYEPISERYRVPIVITGFEPIDLLEGTLMVVRQLERAAPSPKTSTRACSAATAISRPASWSTASLKSATASGAASDGFPKSGYKLRWEYREHDAERLFDVREIDTKEPAICISGQILKGIKKPHDCPAFGTLCTPQNPLGATMVSAEGACAAYYAYGRHLQNARNPSFPSRTPEKKPAPAPPTEQAQKVA